MFRYAGIFLGIALIAAFFGFADVENFSFAGAKVLFAIFLVLAVLSCAGGAYKKSAST